MGQSTWGSRVSTRLGGTPRYIVIVVDCQSTQKSCIMSDEEYYEEEEVTSQTSKKGDGSFLKARQGAKKGELDEQLREYINEWRKQRAKEEDELKRLKEKQAKRKEIRAEQEKKLAQRKKKRKKIGPKKKKKKKKKK